MCAAGLRINCPRCGKEVVRCSAEDAPFFPFCSRRCKLVDLGSWLNEEHRISEPLPGGAATESAEEDAP